MTYSYRHRYTERHRYYSYNYIQTVSDRRERQKETNYKIIKIKKDTERERIPERRETEIMEKERKWSENKGIEPLSLSLFFFPSLSLSLSLVWDSSKVCGLLCTVGLTCFSERDKEKDRDRGKKR